MKSQIIHVATLWGKHTYINKIQYTQNYERERENIIYLSVTWYWYMKQWPNLWENQNKVSIIVTQQSLPKEKRGSENEVGERERDVKGCLGDNWWKRETQKSPPNSEGL